jgi:hypothetical protein
MYWTTLLLPLAASAATLESRQLGGSTLAGVDELKPQFRKIARRTMTKMGRMFFLRFSNGIRTDFCSIYHPSKRMETFLLS